MKTTLIGHIGECESTPRCGRFLCTASRSLLGWLLLAVLMGAGTARAQSFFDCNCLASQSVLFTNGCCGVVPDLCAVATNCYSSTVFPPPGFTCSQSPPAGTVTCSNTTISVTIIENATGNSTNCVVTFFVGVATGPQLICPPPQTVPCNATYWLTNLPTWGNPCCTNPIINLVGITTNWPTVTMTWLGFGCGTVGQCSQTITFADPNGLPCNCLDIFCPSNIIVQTCLGPSTAGGSGGVTNILFPAPWVSNYCIGNITNVFCTPPSGSPFPVGTNTVICKAQDDLGNTATCSFDVIVLGDTTPPVINCGLPQTVQCGSTWSPFPPTAFDACCTNFVTIQLFGSVTNVSTPCLESIDFWWHVMDCHGNYANCTNTVNVVDTTPPVIVCNSNQTYQCGNSAGQPGGWTPVPPQAIDACCGNNVTVTLLNAVTNNSATCNQVYTFTWQATDCCSNSSYCTEVITLVDTNPPFLFCSPQILPVECGDPIPVPTAIDGCCGSNVTVTLLGSSTNFINTCRYFVTNLWQATDCCTNSTTCTETILVQDKTPPNVNCVSNLTIQCGASPVFTPPTAFDNCCGAAVTISVIATTTNAPSPCPTFVTRDWLIVDCCGNATNCSQTIAIIDTTPPVITCALNQTVQCGSAWTFVPPTATDNCCINSANGISLFNTVTNNSGTCVEVISAIWKATDCCGNSALCTNTVTVVDTTPPVINCNASGATIQVVQCGSPITPPTASDLCCKSNVTVAVLNAVTNFVNPCRYFVTNTWQAIDCCSNTATCVEIYLIVDTTPPVLTCASNKLVQCGSQWAFDPPTAIDACCGTNVTVSVLSTLTNATSTTCFTVVTRTWQAVDCCTNTTTCSQTVTIVDTTPPVVTCPTNFTVPFGTPWNFTPPTGAVDACCGSNVFVVQMATTTNISNCKMIIKRRWRVYDCCKNFVNCVQTVTVTIPPPINDPCSNPIPITLNAPPFCGNTICATPSGSGTLNPVPCGNSATANDVWYSVTALCNGPIVVNTCNPCPGYPMFDTVLSAYTGPCGALTQVSATACNDNGCGLQSVISFNAVAGQTYLIRVAGAFNAAGWFAIQATQSVTAPPNDYCSNAIPVNIGSPAACGTTDCATPSLSNNIPIIPLPCAGSITANDVWYTYTPQCNGPVTIDTCGTCPGSNTFDTVLSAYTGTCGSLFQIACNNNMIVPPACKKQSIISFPGIAGVTYYIRVSGVPNVSGQFRLNVQQNLTAPTNDLCANAVSITPGTYAWNNCGANTDGPVGGPCTPFQDVWYTFTAPCAGQVWLNTCGSAINTVLNVYSGTSCSSLSLVTCNDDAAPGNGPCGGTTQSYVTFNAIAGQKYYIRVGSSVSGNTGPGQLTLVGPQPPFPTCPPAGPCNWNNYTWFRIVGNPNCLKWSWAITAPCCVSLMNTNAGPVCAGNDNTLASNFVFSINSAGCPGISAIWVNLGPPKSGRFAICSQCPNIQLSVGGPGVLPQNQCVIANTGGYSPVPVGYCNFNPNIEVIPLSGHDYNNNGIDDAVDIDLGTSQDLNGNGIPDEVEPCIAPEITGYPDSQVVEAGTALTLNASASGAPAPSFQWRKDGVNLPGANSSSYSIPSFSAADAGAYSAVISNGCGSVETVAADLALTPATLPVLYQNNILDGSFNFQVDTRLSHDYIVEYKNDLTDPSWMMLVTVPGSGGPEWVLDGDPLQARRFYRVREVPNP